MADNKNVKFFFTDDLNKYKNLAVKDPLGLYFIEDPSANFYALYKGENLIATGSAATTLMSGLMTPEDRILLNELAASGGLDKLVAVDGSISIVDGEDGKKNISVAISAQDGNALQKNADGLFVPTAQEVNAPEYSIEKQPSPEEGYASSYKLKKVINGEATYVGDTINIAKDMVLQSAVLKKVTEADVPYEGAVVGDPYIEMAFNDAAASHIYVPVKDLVDTYIPGDGIKIENNVISVDLGPDANGLHMTDGRLNLGLATAEAAGAMSAEDKKALDAIPVTYASKAEMNSTTQRVKYDVFFKPAGTTVKITDSEIRICCASDTPWTEQAVGPTGDPSRFYVGLKIYAPIGADHFMEDLKKTIEDTTVFDFTDEFSGRDAYGNGYSVVYLPVAAKQEDGTWKYYGDMSTEDKQIGWYYTSAFYDADNNLLSKETIRINVINENMSTEAKPYYLSSYATKDEVSALAATMTWESL